MYKTVQINCFSKVFCVTAHPCVSTSVPLTYVRTFEFVGCIWFKNVEKLKIFLHSFGHGPTGQSVAGQSETKLPNVSKTSHPSMKVSP